MELFSSDLHAERMSIFFGTLCIIFYKRLTILCSILGSLVDEVTMYSYLFIYNNNEY